MKYSGIGAHRQHFREQRSGLVHDAAADVGQAVPQAIQPFAFPLIPDDFGSNERKKDGYGEDDEIHGF